MHPNGVGVGEGSGVHVAVEVGTKVLVGVRLGTAALVADAWVDVRSTVSSAALSTSSVGLASGAISSLPEQAEISRKNSIKINTNCQITISLDRIFVSILFP